MNKRLVGIGVVIVLFLLGVGAFLMAKKSPAPVTSNQVVMSPTAQSSVSSVAMTQGTLKNLLEKGTPVSCTFSKKVTSSDVEGTVYVAKGKMKGDFKTIVEGNTTNGHMIVEAGNSYIWTDLSKQGLKMPIASATASPLKNSSGVDINQNVDYSCQDWNVDDSVFVLPSDVNFQTIPTYPVPTIGSTGNPAGSVRNSY